MLSAHACPICDAPGPHPVLLRVSGHVLLRCGDCTGCFFEDRTPPDYAANMASELYQQCYIEQNAGLHHMTRLLFQLDRHGPGSLLDFGCGFGFPVDVASKVLGWRAVGVDPSHYAADGARLLGADIRREYLNSNTVLGEPFDLVLGSEVIEHIPDLYPFLALLRSHMRPGAALVMTTPDADGLSPALNPGTLFAMLSVGGHLVLFTARSMEHMLRRAGFAHVHTQVGGNTLVAWASDAPLRFRADADARHSEGYRTYLRRLLDTAEPGGHVWNGAAGRLFTLDAADAPLEEALALFARISEGWRLRFGLDLVRLRLPEPLRERELAGGGTAPLDRLRAGQPINLGGVLYSRALLELRMPGRLPDRVLDYARAALTVAEQMARALQACGLIDYDLHHTAWRSRMLAVDCLAELAPELEGHLLAGLAAPSHGALADRMDPPASVVVARMAPWFSAKVHATEYDAAMLLEPWLRDLQDLCDATRGDQMVRYHLLFTVGVLRLNHLRDLAGALAAFRCMMAEAEGEMPNPALSPLAQHFLPVARDHAANVAAMMAG